MRHCHFGVAPVNYSDSDSKACVTYGTNKIRMILNGCGIMSRVKGQHYQNIYL